MIRPYYNNPRRDVLPYFPEGAKKVLDVGCGAGAWGELLKTEKGCEVWGIEYVPDEAAEAEKRLDRVFQGDAESILPTLPQEHFDVITFNDVLEHLVHPERVLALARPLLARDGYVMASIPNFRYWDAFKRVLLARDFPYEAQGIFDRTHLRFYTIQSIPKLFGEGGLDVYQTFGINATPSRALRLINLFTFGLFSDCQYLQYVVLAEPRKGVS